MKGIIYIIIILCCSSIHGYGKSIVADTIPIQLVDFDFENQDSLLKCQIIYSYDDFVRYFNNWMDQNNDDNTRLYSKNALWKLLSRDTETSDNQRIAIQDQSVEGKTSSYPIEVYLSKMNELITLSYAYEKKFLASGCPTFKGRQTNNICVDEATDLKYSFPLQRFELEYVEKSLKSGVIHSNVRAADYIHYFEYSNPKKLSGKITKMVDPEEFNEYSTDYRRLQKEYLNKKGRDSRDTVNIERVGIIKDSLLTLEDVFTRKVLKINIISENTFLDAKSKIKELHKEASACNCVMIEPEDADGDGFNAVVDCNDNDANIYPGAPVNCNDDNEDDNCDGIPDKCCDDLDGDGFYGGSNCDCNKNLYSDNIRDKCDCDDNDNTVYPGAPINCLNRSKDDNCDGILDVDQLEKGTLIHLGILDNVYPPYGLTKFGRDDRFYIYSGVILAGAATATYFKLKSNGQYKEYLNAFTLRNQDDLYDEANVNHKRFIVATGFTVGVYLASHLDLRLKYSKHKKLSEQINAKRADCALIYELELKPFSVVNNNFGSSIVFTF